MKKILLSMLVAGLIAVLGSCNAGSGTDASKTDTITKNTKDIDTIKMLQPDSSIPEKKIDNSVPE